MPTSTRMQWSDYRPQRVTFELIRKLANSAAPEKPKEIRDRESKLILRHQPSGYLGLYVNLGKDRREFICEARQIIDQHATWTLGSAKNEAQRLRGQHVDGRNFAAERKTQRAVPTLRTYLDETYSPWVKQSRRGATETLRRLECFAETLARRKLNELTPAQLESWRSDRRREGVKAETINRDLATLRAALSRAVVLEIIRTNPLLGVETEEVDRHKRVVRALTGAEKAKLIGTLQARDDKKRAERESANKWRAERGQEVLPPIGRFADTLTPAVVTSLETGLRFGELSRLQWPSVDIDEKTVRVHGKTVKTFETRDIPLNDLAHKTLNDWWLQCGRPESGPAFTTSRSVERVGSLKKSYHAVLAAAGIPRVNRRGERVNWHSLRHTFGTLLGAANVDPTTLMKLMGHANLATTQRYLHTDEKRKREAVKRLEVPLNDN